MYGISPFEKKTYDLFNSFHDFEENFFGNTSLPSCKTDIKDEGDKYVLEAELPGFDKDDIKAAKEDMENEREESIWK